MPDNPFRQNGRRAKRLANNVCLIILILPILLPLLLPRLVHKAVSRHTMLVYVFGELGFLTRRKKQVEVQTASDVQAVLAFAKQTKVDVVIKNTGVSTVGLPVQMKSYLFFKHDYIGRSSGPGTLALWVSF